MSFGGPPSSTVAQTNFTVDDCAGEDLAPADKLSNWSEGQSETDPALLMAASLFVDDILMQAQEEARRRQQSETEVIDY